MNHLEILTALCDLPTAPYCEGEVIAWLRAWSARHEGTIRNWQDKAGNVYLEYRKGRAGRGLRGLEAHRDHAGGTPVRTPAAPGGPLVWEAHMDHPGFTVERQRRDGRIEAVFRGGVKPSHFKGARVRFWLPAAGEWIASRVLEVKTVRNQRHMKVLLTVPARGTRLPAGTLGMWDLPEAAQRRGLFAARVCDDLAGLAAIICALEELMAHGVRAHVVALCSRAEEVGFAGVLAACEKGWVPKGSPVIGIETSKAFAASPQGAGPIIRVGDRTGIFSAGLTHFLTQTAGRMADEDGGFKYQRKLMDGGTCNSTAFAAYGYDAGGICLALGNYHNMYDRTAIGPHAPYRAPVARAGPGIASETISLADFEGLVRLLVETARHIGEYRPGMERSAGGCRRCTGWNRRRCYMDRPAGGLGAPRRREYRPSSCFECFRALHFSLILRPHSRFSQGDTSASRPRKNVVSRN